MRVPVFCCDWVDVYMCPGVWLRGVSDQLTLPMLKENVIDALGGAVHVFIHTEPHYVARDSDRDTWGEGDASALIEEDCERHIGEWLKGLLIRRTASRVRGDMIGSIYGAAMQYTRLRDAYEMMLGQETTLTFRYSHVVRMRTDAFFAIPWPSGLRGLETVVPAGSIAGPMWSRTVRPRQAQGGGASSEEERADIVFNEQARMYASAYV